MVATAASEIPGDTPELSDEIAMFRPMDEPAGAACAPYFQDSVSLNGGEIRVYRCDWGWCVKRGDAAGRSRYLDEAFEIVLGRRADTTAMRALVDVLGRELTARRDREGRTASTTVATADVARAVEGAARDESAGFP